jgi:antitoxin (DNA-binding transcriptional repressor) of toxin-antitoxin stability system
MKTISMLELRSKGREVVKRLDRGERLELTYRGRKVATMEPALRKKSSTIPADDPILEFLKRAEPLGGLTNEDIDQVLYGRQADPR